MLTIAGDWNTPITGVTPSQRTDALSPLAPYLHGGERDLLPSPPTSNTPPPALASHDKIPPAAPCAGHLRIRIFHLPIFCLSDIHLHHHYAQRRPTLVVLSSGATTTSNATSTSTFHTTPSRPAYRAALYTSLGPSRERRLCDGHDGVVNSGKHDPSTSSPTPQFATPQYTTLDATPRTLTARYEYLGEQAHGAQGAVGQQDLYFYTLASSPVSSASTSSSSTTSESCFASEESTSEEEEEEEEGYDAPAYTERTADFAMRHTPATADFAQPCTHRPMALHVVPADPSARAYRPQQQAQQLQPQYGRVGGGYARRWSVQSARRSPVRVGGWSPPGYQGAAQQTGVYQGGGQRRPRCSARCTRRSSTSNRRTSSTHRTNSIRRNTRHASTSGTPPRPTHARRRSGAPCPAYAAAGHGQWTLPRLPRFADLERWSPGVGEVVPSHAPQVPSHAPQGLAPPAHTHVPSHTLPQLTPLAQAPMPRRAVFANTGSPGVSGPLLIVSPEHIGFTAIQKAEAWPTAILSLAQSELVDAKR
ncbi:hypothetical protein C8J57DRAFT_1719914 [Mycena rebaudengoi]|nr:hypothetical protein C8J57DRAFT_1719914 [Mycena rebaudengoi]